MTESSPGTLPIPNNITTGIKYTKLGMVCITSRMGVTMPWARSERDIRIPMGRPNPIQSKVHTMIILTVLIVSSHIPKKPIKKRLMADPTTILILRLASHATKATKAIKSGQGVANKNFSSQIKKCNRGSKKDSIFSP